MLIILKCLYLYKQLSLRSTFRCQNSHCLSLIRLLSHTKCCLNITVALSQVLADEFLEGSLLLDSFLERFHSLRCLAHRRRVCIEKLQEILRQKNQGAGESGMTSEPCSNSEAISVSPWQQPQQQQQQKPSVSSNPPNCALQYPSYPVSPPSQPCSASTAAPSNPSGAFQPYSSQAVAFIPSSGYPSAQLAFAPSTCPYPTQPAFPAPQGPPFGQFGPSNAPYPSPYPYGGYSYPVGSHMPPSQSPTGRPLYRPGFGVPQPYS